MPTTYVSSSAINQKFTSGPYIGSIVNKSFSNISNITFGPPISLEQKFISGSDAEEGQPGFDPNAVNTISACGQYYNRIQEDSILCPPGDCTLPILTSAALSSSCTATYDGKYNITYNSGSSTAIITYIQYSTTSSFTSNVASQSITNITSPRPPINISNLPGDIPSNGYTPVYFRAFNECSNGKTSSYSNVLTASCVAPPTPTYDFFKLTILNQSGKGIYLKQSTSTTPLYIIAPGTTLDFDQPTISFQLSIAGTATTTPPTKLNTYKQYNISASASTNYSGLISTTIIPQIDSRVNDSDNYTITTVAPLSQSLNTKTTTLYDLHTEVTSNDLTTFPRFKTVFAASGLSTATSDVIVNIDRTNWKAGGNINIIITPLVTQYYLYDPIEGGTCVLSGTPITLADGSTIPIDNLKGGDRVLSPSILTLPYDNNFDLFNWAINKLILTEGTAVVTGNKRSQVNEVYSINNGTLTTTSTHQHLFKQNGTWNIKTTPYLMVGDYLSDRNGEEILIESIEILTGEFKVFTLDVEENDLYIANGILTHNIKAK